MQADQRKLGYREVSALRDVSIKLGHGEVVGVIGYNGSGKSTLLQIIAGTLQPTSGRVTVNGRVAALLELGSGFNPEFTGRENAFLYGQILGFSRHVLERRMGAIEEFAEIGEFIDEPVKTYSSGMVTRLAFSVLTQLDPDILIVDEALSVGDAYFQHKSGNLIRRFQKEGRTMLIVSHDIGTIKSMCTRAILLERGMVIREGPASAVVDYYNALVAKKKADHEITQIERERGRVVTRSGDKSVVIGDVDVLDQQGRSCRAFTVGDTALITCALEFRAEVVDPTVGIMLRDRIGTDVFGSNTFHHRLKLGRFKAGDTCEVTFAVGLSIGCGRYSVTTAVHVANDHRMGNYDWQDNVVVFDVLPGSEPTFAGTAHLPLAIRFERENVSLIRPYEWGHVIDFSVNGNSVRYKEGGWSHSETQYTWTDGNEAFLRLRLAKSECDRRLVVRAAGFCNERIPSQLVEVVLNRRVLAKWDISGEADFEAIIPKELLREEQKLRFEFRVPNAIIPCINGKGDSRMLGIWVSRVVIV